MKCQCRSKDFFHELQCQGVQKHSGKHWAYCPAGNLILWLNKREVKKITPITIMLEDIPPGSKSYISPDKMFEKRWTVIRRK